MITPNTLLDIAINTPDWLVRDQALLAGLFLENEGVAETTLIGPFSIANSDLKKGDRVMIKKGSKITSTSKRLNRNAGRDYIVTLFGLDKGTIYEDRIGQFVIINSQVCWTSDGYWCNTDITNVVKQ